MPGGRGNIKPEDGKPFVKGDSRCHRKGRPRKLPGLDRLLADVLGEKISDGKAKEAVAMEWILISLRNSAIKKGDVAAANTLMDRAYGKLRQTNDLNIDFDNLTESQLDEIIDRILNKKK